MTNSVIADLFGGNGGPRVPAASNLPTELSLALNTALDRMLMARAFGQKAYSGDRDYNQVLGYPDTLDINDFVDRYKRQDIAARVVDLPPQDTWKKPPPVTEDGDDGTEFVRTWEALVDKMRVFSTLTRLDRVSGIGRYGVLYMGYRDGEEDASQPVNTASLSRPEDLIFLRPFSEQNVTIDAYETDKGSERFGLPTIYKLGVDGGLKLPVHYTRILHVADNRLDSDIYGTPRLELVYNRLDDLLKLVGGSAEATWLNMRPGTLLTTQQGYEFEGDTTSQQNVQREIAEYLHGLARIMTIEGVDVQTIMGQVVDVTGPFDVQIALISAASGIPQRVLLGSAAGQLAAAQEDMRQWYGHIAYRQTNYAEPDILRPFIDRQIEYGILPPPASGAYNVGEQDDKGNWSWPSLMELSDAEQARVGLTRAQTAKVLQHPVTQELPITSDEGRQLLGLQPLDGSEPAPVEIADEVISNLMSGAIDGTTFVSWLEGEGT